MLTISSSKGGMRCHMCLKQTAQRTIKFSNVLQVEAHGRSPRPSVHRLLLAGRGMINVVSTMITDRAVLGDIANGAGHLHQSCTLMTVHPVTVTAHAVDTVT